MQLLSRRERDWLTAFGVGALFIACSPTSTRCAVGASQDLADALAAQRRTLGRDARFTGIWWISSTAAALELATAVTPGATVEETEAAVREAARRLGIPLAEHEPTLARARAAIAKLDRGLALAKATGTLSFFNARYRVLRQQAVAAGRPFQSYGDAYTRLKAQIGKRVAEAGGSGKLTLEGVVDLVLPSK
jgi:hypothetical protein